MSTKSLDFSLHLNRPHITNHEATPVKLREDLKNKTDLHHGSKLQIYEEIGAQLIEDHLLLTALELYMELAEAGHDIFCLKRFFSNPGNFEKSAKKESSRLLVRSLSQTTLDSLDIAPISEDGDKSGGDRVAVLEFELRKAKETISALRENLTQQAELENGSIQSDSSASSLNHTKIKSGANHINTPEPMRAYEQRAINFLVHEYLLTQGYRLTSITFSDENAEQDFEHWDDVGLNTERPPDLLTMFRSGHRSKTIPSTTSVSAETQTDVTLVHEGEATDLTMQVEESENQPSQQEDNILFNLPQTDSITSSKPISSQGLKPDVQQGVIGDVRSKFNQFFKSPSSSQVNAKINPANKLPSVVGKSTDRPTFSSIFSNK